MNQEIEEKNFKNQKNTKVLGKSSSKSLIRFYTSLLYNSEIIKLTE